MSSHHTSNISGAFWLIVSFLGERDELEMPALGHHRRARPDHADTRRSSASSLMPCGSSSRQTASRTSIYNFGSYSTTITCRNRWAASWLDPGAPATGRRSWGLAVDHDRASLQHGEGRQHRTMRLAHGCQGRIQCRLQPLAHLGIETT